VLTAASALGGCGGDSRVEANAASTADTRLTADPGAPTGASSAVTTDLYDVDGHRLFMQCAGDGPVTVVYVHGWVNDAGYVPHASAQGISDLLDDDFRVCRYDRRNVGSSQTVDAVQTPKDVLHDMEGVLAAGHVDPPYILMAASFGGLVASSFLAAHPDDVVGMVLIDTMFPDELRLDRFLPPAYRFATFTHDDKCCTLERISQFALISSLQGDIGHEPPIPVVYLASEQEPRDQKDYESPAYDSRILDAQRAYVDRFSPGILRWVDAPHFMEPVVPDVIADAVREVHELARDH
jgi:pimeloyl-ACP methyl ester carboxylesterase